MLSEQQDMEAAKRFFQQAVEVVGHAPERVTIDGHDSYRRAIREPLGNDVLIGPTAPLTIDWSKIIVALSSVITQCADLGVWPPQHAFAVPSMKSASSFGSGPP